MRQPDLDPSAPTWLVEPCPWWCARTHEEDDHPEDRYHQSEPAMLPALAGAADTVPVTDSIESLDLLIRRGRYVGESLEWVLIEPAEAVRPRLMLTIESARLLLPHLADQIAEP